MSSKVASSSRLALSRFFLGANHVGISTRAMSSVANQAPFEPVMQQHGRRQQQHLLSTLPQPAEDVVDYCGLADAIGLLTEHEKQRRQERPSAAAYEVIPFNNKAAKEISSVLSNKSIDKVVLCMRHGESEHTVFERELKLQGKDLEKEMLHNEDYPRDPILTKRGFGQALTISRKFSDCCNRDTKLMPELVVVSPLQRATITALLSLPQHLPLSVRNTKWICHPALMESSNGNSPADMVSSVKELSTLFPGIDYSLLHDQQNAEVQNWSDQMKTEGMLSETENKVDLLARADSFLDWLKNREERVIVVASHSSWLQAFCGFSVDYKPKEYGLEPFQTGELRCLAVRFEKN